MNGLDKMRSDKQEIFEEERLEERQEIDHDIQKHKTLLVEWREGKLDTKTVLETLTPVLHNTQKHPIVRMSAFEHILQLNERRQPENRDIVELLLATAASEPRTEMRMAEFGIIGSRLSDTLVLQEFNNSSDSLKQQFANTLDALVHEIRIDPSAPAEIRRIAEIAASPDRNSNALWQKIEYMAKLYQGKAENLWPTYEQLQTHIDSQDTLISERELFIPALKGRRLLPEGHACSLEKELEANQKPRVSGDEKEKGAIIPLRVFIGVMHENGSFEGVAIQSVYASTFISELRRINTLRIRSKSAGEQPTREQLRQELLREWKQRVWNELPEKDREIFGSWENLIMRVETLFDENGLTKLLHSRLNVTFLNRDVDPTGELERQVEDIIASEQSDKEKLQAIESLLPNTNENKIV